MPQLLGRSQVQVLTATDLVLGKWLPVPGPSVFICQVGSLTMSIQIVSWRVARTQLRHVARQDRPHLHTNECLVTHLDLCFIRNKYVGS